MKKQYIAILLPLLLFSSCTLKAQSGKFSDVIHHYNDENKSVTLTTSSKQSITTLIKNKTFNSVSEISAYQRSIYHFSVSFDLAIIKDESYRYSIDLEEKVILKYISALSSTLNDEYALLTDDECNLFIKAFKLPTVDLKKGINCLTLLFDYDYGLHVENRLTPLLTGSELFFNPLVYKINNMVAGDTYNIYYSGEIYILVTYPSRVDLSKATIHDVIKIPAYILKGSLLSDPGSNNNYNFVSGNYSTKVFPDYVILDNDTYQSVNNYYDEKVFATFARPYKSNNLIKALYQDINL